MLAPQNGLTVIIQGDILPLIQFLNYNALRYADVQYQANRTSSALQSFLLTKITPLRITCVGADLPSPVESNIHPHISLPSTFTNLKSTSYSKNKVLP